MKNWVINFCGDDKIPDLQVYRQNAMLRIPGALKRGRTDKHIPDEECKECDFRISKGFWTGMNQEYINYKSPNTDIYDELAVMLWLEQKFPHFAASSEDRNRIKLDRKQPALCIICNRIHHNASALAVIGKNRAIFLRCSRAANNAGGKFIGRIKKD